MKSAFITILAITILYSFGYSQKIINGDFEDNNLSDCLFNPGDGAFNASIDHCWSIGNNTFSGIDLQTFSCGYPDPPNNDWFASLSQNYSNSLGWGNDVLILEIDVNLVQGEEYEISYYDFAIKKTNGEIPPVEIGLSMDSISFGDSVHVSTPQFENWRLRTFSFIAPNNGKYLSVRNEDTALLDGWNCVDNFVFNIDVGISDQKENNEFALHPNPCHNSFYISVDRDDQLNISIYNSMSKKVVDQVFTRSKTVDTEHLSSGIYFYQIQSETGLINTGKLIKV